MKNSSQMYILGFLGIVIAGVVGFVAGTKSQSAQPAQLPPQAGNGYMRMRSGNGGPMMFGGRNGQNRPVLGQIIASDASSITVKMPDGSSRIILFSQNTTVTKSVAAQKIDLTVGTGVLVTGTMNSDGSMTAKAIQISPMFLAPTGSPQPNANQ